MESGSPVLFVVLYSVIILNGLRAYVVPQNFTANGEESVSEIGGIDFVTGDASLSFLRGLILDEQRTGRLEVTETKRRTKRSLSSASVVPQYMLDMYDRLSDKKLKLKFDKARSFAGTGSKPEKFQLCDSGIANLPMRRLAFNISSFPPTESVQFAQVRIQVRPDIPEEKRGTRVTAEIYGLRDSKPSLVASGDSALQGHPLLTLEVTSFVREALVDRAGLQLEFAVSVRPHEFDDVFAWDAADAERPQLLLLSSDVPGSVATEDPVFRRLKRSLSEKLGNSQRESVVGDAFPGAGNRSEVPDLSHNRSKRSEEEDEELEEQSNYIVEELGRVRKGKVRKKKNPCRRKPLLVNFSDINYDQWIIAPPSYEAFECTGRCSFPMSAHLTPTKHAIIQTLMHSLEPKQISRACCVPTRLASISVLYIDDDGVVTYMYDYEDMVVSECGCR